MLMLCFAVVFLDFAVTSFTLRFAVFLLGVLCVCVFVCVWRGWVLACAHEVMVLIPLKKCLTHGLLSYLSLYFFFNHLY